MKTTKVLPDGYQRYCSLNLAANMIKFFVAGVLPIAILSIIFTPLILILQNKVNQIEFGYRYNPYIIFSGLIFSAVIMPVTIHSIIHRIYFWYYTGEWSTISRIYKLSSTTFLPPKWYIPRNKYILIALAPLIGITSLGVLLWPVLPRTILPFLFIFAVFNLAYSSDDIFIIGWLLTKPPTSYVYDHGDGISVYVDRH